MMILKPENILILSGKHVYKKEIVVKDAHIS